MFPMNRKPCPVAVEYTAGGVRVTRDFPDGFKARRFYAAKLAAGAAPRVVASNKELTMAKTTKTAATPAPVATNGTVTKRETAVLTALAKARDPLTRTALKAASGVKSGLAAIIGAVTKDDGGAAGADGLVSRGYVKVEKRENEPFTFSITAKGRKAIGK